MDCQWWDFNNSMWSVHRVHCQLIQLFARGIEDVEAPPSQSCTSCCSLCDPKDKYASIGGHTWMILTRLAGHTWLISRCFKLHGTENHKWLLISYMRLKFRSDWPLPLNLNVMLGVKIHHSSRNIYNRSLLSFYFLCVLMILDI